MPHEQGHAGGATGQAGIEGKPGLSPYRPVSCPHRLVCENGLIGLESIKHTSVAHDHKDMVASIEHAIQAADFSRQAYRIKAQLGRLWQVKIPREQFAPVIHAVLGIRRPEHINEKSPSRLEGTATGSRREERPLRSRPWIHSVCPDGRAHGSCDIPTSWAALHIPGAPQPSAARRSVDA